MTAWGWMARSIACLPLVAMLVASGGCKSLNERYIALEVWKYERCFGHLPPGFVPPGAAAPAAAPPRVCGQGAACPQGCPPATAGCDNCQGGVAEGGMAMPPPGIGVPTGPGGSPGPGAGAGLPTPAGVTAGKPVIISDEVVLP